MLPRITSKRSKRLLRSSVRKRLARVGVTLLIFLVAFGLFWIVLRYLMAPKNPTDDSGAVSTYQVRIAS